MKYLSVPENRIAVLIGKEGKAKAEIERRGRCKLEINSETGDIWIHDDPENPLLTLKTEEVIKAIGQGFSPQHAFKLFKEDFYLATIDIRDYTKKSPSHLKRIKGRIIGKGGKAKRLIEEMSSASLSIFGDTISIIADQEHLEIAKRATDMLLSGYEHSTVYRFLEKKRRELKLAGV
jgi:ribosomal RNA assembly protein